METQEVRQEQAEVLRRMSCSPGWDLYQTRLRKLLEEREREKASHLRKADAHRATLTQGQVDGLQEALAFIDTLTKELQSSPDDGSPAY